MGVPSDHLHRRCPSRAREGEDHPGPGHSVRTSLEFPSLRILLRQVRTGCGSCSRRTHTLQAYLLRRGAAAAHAAAYDAFATYCHCYGYG